MIEVAVNTHVLSRGMSGSSRGLGQVLAALREDGGLSVTELPGPAMPRTRAARVATWASWDLFGVHRAMGDAAVLVAGCNVGRGSRRHPDVLLMHDVMVLDHPEAFDPKYVAYARALFPMSARHSTVVVTPSRYSATRIADRFHLREMPQVIPWPCVGALGVPSSAQIAARLARPVVTVVGATEPHKQQQVALLAVRHIRQITGLAVELCLVGRAGRDEESLGGLIRAFDPDRSWIRREESLTEDALLAQYRSSWLVMQTSLDEGFGLPVLEACGSGVPVVHSGRGGLSEVHPAGSVDSVAPEAFTRRAIALLDVDAYVQACRDAVTSAARHDWARFATGWQRVVRSAGARR
jgi:glycosyltransferase involved in cell wall biosynthesis